MRTARRSGAPVRDPWARRLAPCRLSTATATIALLGLLATTTASAHDLGFTRTTVVFLPGGEFRIDMQVDLDALALGMPQDTDDGELMAVLDAMPEAELEQTVETLRQTFLRRMRLRFDDETFLPEVTFPDRGSDRARRANTVLGLTARLSGRIPAGATELTLQASRAFPPLHLTFVDLRARTMSPQALDELLRFEEPVAGTAPTTGADAESGGMAEAGVAAESSANPLIADRFGDLVTMRQILERGDRSDPYPLDRPPPEPSRLDVVGQYVGLGFEHIVPLGLDHILFVLGLFLLNTSWRPLLAQVTAFTAAHTLALGLSTYGVVGLPPSIVEPLIALSIAWVAFENVITEELKPWRPAVVFGFGLLHGLGFAGVLARLGLPRGEFLTALLSFNAGVELGQLAVIVVAFLALGAFRQRSWYRTRVTVPLSIAIGVVGVYWAITRVFSA